MSADSCKILDSEDVEGDWEIRRSSSVEESRGESHEEGNRSNAS